MHAFSATFRTAGSQSITPPDTATSSVTGSQTVTVTANVAANLFLATPASATAGTPFSVTVSLKDAYGNIATSYAGTIHFTSSDSPATLPADYTFVAAHAGTHTFTGGVTFKTSGGQTITATDTVNSSLTPFANLLATTPPAPTLSLTAPPPAVANTPFNATVTLTDAYGNPTPAYT